MKATKIEPTPMNKWPTTPEPAPINLGPIPPKYCVVEAYGALHSASRWHVPSFSTMGKDSDGTERDIDTNGYYSKARRHLEEEAA